MKILILGEGSREHAIALMISRSYMSPKIYNIGIYRNPGIARITEATGGKAIAYNDLNPRIALNTAKEINPDLIIVGPEEYQFKGFTDLLLEEGFAVFGVSKKLAEIEKSKVFMRMLMCKHKIPGSLIFKAFRELDSAIKYVEKSGDAVLKPARQAGGKGVKVIADFQEYLKDSKRRAKLKHTENIIANVMKNYRDIDYKLLVEERVDGVEYTIMTISDGYTILPLPAIQDHPHAFEMDIGPETGGMGSIQGPGYTLPFITNEEYSESVDIIYRTVKALQKEIGEKYIGVLSGQMMLTPQYGPTVIEFYSRFGDPEVSNLIPIIDTDLLEIFNYAVSGKLSRIKLRIREDIATVVKASAPIGYPNNRSMAADHPVSIDENEIKRLGCYTLYSGIYLDNSGNMLTTGSRAVEVSCSGSTIEDAALKANLALKHVNLLDGWGLFYRRDIGLRDLIAKRTKQAMIARNVYRYRRKSGLLYSPIRACLDSGGE